MQLHKPEVPPPFVDLLRKLNSQVERILATAPDSRSMRDYLHWDKLHHLTPPAGLTAEEWWLGVKLQRFGQFRPVALEDNRGQAFRFLVPDMVQERLHEIDCLAGGSLRLPEPVTNPQTRDQYLIRSLMEEAITSSQLEGAATTREVAKEMIRTGRPARDKSERMILNNYLTMKRIVEIKDREMTPELVLDLHRRVTEDTLDDPSMSGRFRRPDQQIVVNDLEGEVYHVPPPAEQLAERCRILCDFANGKTPGFFIHPVVRAILLHFWLAYDHPFVDGNGRTARALFYWAMLHDGFWLFEFISISAILRQAPAKYARSFLYTETDDNDLTYFIVDQAGVIQRAIEELHAYIGRKTEEVRESEARLRALRMFNHRQTDLLRHALKHPHQEYEVQSHQQSHGTAYETARTDLLQLHAKGLLDMRKRGKTMVFSPAPDLAARLRKADAK